MNNKKLLAAERAAKEFLAAITAMRAEDYEMQFVVGTKVSGTVRRKSMDLTRALAELRKPL